jgi:hypothetical protein
MRRGDGRRGSSILESILFLPVLFLLLFGMIEFARISYTYYTLHKMMYALARYLGTQQGVNFCDEADPAVVAAKAYALTGTTDSTAVSQLPSLTASMIQIRIERYDAGTGEISECACSITGCDAGVGGLPPDFIVVSIPDGYMVQPRFPYIQVDPILLRPQVRMPFGGT